MRKNFSNRLAAFFVFAFSLLLVSACKTTKPVAQQPEVPVTLAPQPADTIFRQVMDHQFRFTWLSAKTSVTYTDANNESTDFTANVRMLRDSIIWINVTKLGVEGARALLTPDSVRILDRIHNTSITRDYSYFEDLLKVPVTFDMIQALLTGNYFSGVPGKDVISVYTESPYYILSTLPRMKELRGEEEKNPDHPVVQDHWIDTTYRITRSRLMDDNALRKVTLEYSDFVSLAEGRLPLTMDLSIEAVKPSKVNVRYVKYSFDGPLTFPFTIPEKFNRQ